MQPEAVEQRQPGRSRPSRAGLRGAPLKAWRSDEEEITRFCDRPADTDVNL